MHSDRARAALVDILRNIELAESFVDDITLEQFADDVLRVYATPRALGDHFRGFATFTG